MQEVLFSCSRLPFWVGEGRADEVHEVVFEVDLRTVGLDNDLKVGCTGGGGGSSPLEKEASEG